ncbi:MAG: adenylate/guanylate cyclase domain-containing protein [Alphaproteobacteria bacterium]
MGERRAAFSLRGVLSAAAVAVAAVSLYLFFHNAPFAEAIEGLTLNWRFRLRGAIEPPARVAIIAIDDRSLSALQHWPVPRDVLAEAANRLRAAGAAAIGFDLLFAEPDPSPARAGDAALAKALAEADGAVLATALSFGDDASGAGEAARLLEGSVYRVVDRPGGTLPLLRATGALVPTESLRAVAFLGHVNVPVDADGAIHNLPLAIALGDEFVPALPVALARRALGLGWSDVPLAIGQGIALGPRFVPTDARTRLPLNHYGPPGTIATHSLADLLAGNLPRDAIEGRAVLVGATALGLGDTFVGPYSAAQPGVEVTATALGNLIDGSSLRRGSSTILWDILATAILAFAAFALAERAPPWIAGAGTVALLLGWFALAQWAFVSQRLWLTLSFPAAALLMSAGLAVAMRAMRERRIRREAERQRRNLMRYHSPVIAERLAAEAGDSFADREQQAAILFADMAGFTGRSERLGPKATAALLRELHGRIERAVLAHGGVLDKFIGDGAMVIFGIPEKGAEDAAAALACARELAGDFGAWNASLMAAGQEPFGFGIGIHYGPVVITRLGGAAQIELTAAGDTVNVASRIEAATRRHGASIAITEAAAAAVRAAGRASLLDGFQSRSAEPIRGRDHAIDIWVLPRT